jgi:tetratricopeptide (TPR) repeat protein
LVIWSLALAAATLAAYLPVARAAWIWDDDYHVTHNVNLRSLHGLHQLWFHIGAVPQYYPLTHTTFWIEYHLWGYHPLGYHLDNVLLHIANAILVGLILRRLALPAWWLAALIFALHPIEVESVAWVTERKNLLSGFFFLSAAWIALDVWRLTKPTDSHPSARPPHGSKSAYCLCLALFLCALLSKTVTATLPAVILLLIWWKRRRIAARQWASLLPFLLIGAAMGSLTAWMERHVVGAVGPAWDWTFPQRILIASHAIWFYFGKLLWPHPLIFIYHKWTVSSAQWVYPLGLLALLIAAYRINRGLFVALIFFCMVIFPALGFANTYPMRFSFVADHFQYLAGIGPIALAAGFIRRPLLGIPLLLILGLLTFRQAHVYANAQTLWTDVISKDDDSAIGHGNLGSILTDRRDFVGAAANLNKAIQIDPNYVEARINLGSIAEAIGNFDLARSIYRAAIADAPENPLPYWALGQWDRRYGDSVDAKRQFEMAARFFPNPAGAYEQVGEICLAQHDLTGAQTQFHRALSADPDLLSAHNNLASIYLQPNGDLAAARRECEASLAIDPTNPTANNNMALILLARGDIDGAVALFQQALKYDPQFAPARANLDKLRP